LSGGFTSAFVIQHSADDTLVLILVFEVRVDHRSRTQVFSTMIYFTCKGVIM